MSRVILALLALVVWGERQAWAAKAEQPAEPRKQGTEEVVEREETVVVTASKSESTLANAPATMSVISSEALASAPSHNFGDILRAVPGINVIQLSARDVNITSRQPVATLTNSQLVLLDGRTIHLDYFNLVHWELIPSNPYDIKQIEIVRGPASAVWGANALTGVINIITKQPRESVGNRANLQAGVFSRDGGSRAAEGSGSSFSGGLTIARAPNDTLAYRLSAGYVYSEPFSRPTGSIARRADPRVPSAACDVATGAGRCVGGGTYPADGRGTFGTAFENDGARLPKLDLRLDQELAGGGRLTYSAGYSGTQGIVYSGIGPFKAEAGSYFSFGHVTYQKGTLRVSGFGNFMKSNSPNLLNLDPATLAPVKLDFSSQTYDFELGHARVIGGKHLLTYGGNARRNNFEITLTPNVKDRNEFGAYLQEEFFVDKLRLSAGVRVDKFGNISSAVFSPRLAAVWRPLPSHSLRATFNRAFRSPSALNNYLEQSIFAPTAVDLRLLLPLAPAELQRELSQPFRLRVRTAGSEEVSPRYNLKEESLTAYELSYTGTFGRTTLSIAAYQNDTDDNINFSTLLPNASHPRGLPGFDVYTPANAPEVIGINVAGGPVSGRIVAFLAGLPAPFGPIYLPRTTTSYLNLGPLRQRGIEVSLDHAFDRAWSFSGSYSFQNDAEILEPKVHQLPFPSEELALAARNRFNAAVSWNARRLVGTASVSYSDKAFWSDVLTAEFFGYTDAYTLVNASFGMRWSAGKVITTLKGTNLLDEKIQQHIFGDVVGRSVSFEARFQF